MRILTFRVWAPYAHFRRPYTTRSPATFSVPPRPTILGLLGAILGLDKKRYSDQLKGVKIGLKINRPIKKIRTTINLMDTKEDKMIQRTQMLYELISDPDYTVAIMADDYLVEELYKRIKDKSPHYTPYLGTAQHIAKIYDPRIGEYCTVEEIETEYVAPVSAVKPDTQKKYIIEKQAYHIGAERKPTTYIYIAVPAGSSIKVVNTGEVLITDGGHVLW